MKQEDKELLLKDLCSRLPYGVVVELDEKFGFNKGTHALVKELLDSYCVEGIKPYLRPMSSMTEEEEKEFKKIVYDSMNIDNISASAYVADWLYSKHLDVHGLIHKGLALEAPEGMYKK